MDVSIIIPTYNRLWSLPQAIKSCKSSKLRIEIIVIDDGSTDDTSHWLSTQTGITVINQPNLGKDWAVNNGFKKATGKYIRFLDSDDWLLPFSTDELFAVAEKENLDVVCAGYHVVSESGDLLYESLWTVCDDFLAQQLGECDSSHYSAYLFKKDFIKNIPHRQEYGALDDRQFIIEVAMKRPVTGYIRNPTFAHCVHNNERLQTVDSLKESYNHWALLSIYKNCFKTLEKNNSLSERYKKAAIKVLWPLSNWIAKRHLQVGVKVMNLIKELDPNFQVPDSGFKRKLYNWVGFEKSQKLFRIIRFFKYGWQ